MGGYLENALILTASGLALRAVGMGLRVYMAGQLGSEGMGLYQLVFTVYGLAVALATSGVSVAAARMTAEQLGQSKRRTLPAVMGRVLWAAAGLGVTAGALQFALAVPAARWWLGDERAALSLQILAFSLPFMALGAAMRGYFLARRQVKANVGSQMLEQLVRILLVLWLLPGAVERGLGKGCAAIVTANLLSEVVSCLCMLRAYRGDMQAQCARAEREAAPRGTRRRLWHILAPLEASRGIASALTAAENALVPACLALAMGDRSQALSAYGALKGMALPVMFFPFSFLGTLATLLMPEVTEAHIRKDHRALGRLLDKMMFLTGTVAVLAGGLFTLYAEPLAEMLYHDPEVGFYIRVLGPVMPFLYLESMVDGVLKGMDEQISTFKYGLWDSMLRIGAILLLLPRFGMKGFLLVMICSNLLTCGLNYRCMVRTARLEQHWGRWLLRPAAALLAALLLTMPLNRLLAEQPLTQVLCGGLSMALIYGAVLWPFGLGKLTAELLRTRKRRAAGQA